MLICEHEELMTTMRCGSFVLVLEIDSGLILQLSYFPSPIVLMVFITVFTISYV